MVIFGHLLLHLLFSFPFLLPGGAEWAICQCPGRRPGRTCAVLHTFTLLIDWLMVVHTLFFFFIHCVIRQAWSVDRRGREQPTITSWLYNFHLPSSSYIMILMYFTLKWQRVANLGVCQCLYSTVQVSWQQLLLLMQLVPLLVSFQQLCIQFACSLVGRKANFCLFHF